MKKEIEHEYTSNMVCPYCGFTDEDSWETSKDDGVKDCGNCEERFNFVRNISIDYCTSKITNQEGEE